jgi:hypothetical protein
MIFLIVLVAFAALAWVVCELFLFLEEGTPPKDLDVLEMLDKYSNQYNSIRGNYSNSYYIQARSNYQVKEIHKTRWSLLFPYYINGVGVIPIWYKSASQIETLFKELIKGSEFENKNRKKLGLD